MSYSILNLNTTDMAIFKNFYTIIGLFIIVIGVTMIFFPPKFGSFLYGVRTKVTMKNSINWATGQRLFAYSYLIIGLIVPLLGILKTEVGIKPFLLFICLWKLAEYFINKFLIRKFPA